MVGVPICASCSVITGNSPSGSAGDGVTASRSATAPSALQATPSGPAGWSGGRLRIEQAVQMHDEIPHVRVVDGALRLALPGRVGAGVIGIDADDVDVRQVLEVDRVETVQLAAEDKMQQLFRLACP